ncbi:hypothetical protein [Bacillus sp. SA1-12]|nr:hypothetical protein [Bacillus sp. SA1-12]
MNNSQNKTSVKNEYKEGGSSFKVIEINVSDKTESLYAVVTPIKKMQ